jgi:hypothetical protein
LFNRSFQANFKFAESLIALPHVKKNWNCERRKLWNLPTGATVFCLLHSESFEFARLTADYSAAQRKITGLRPKPLYFVRRAAKAFGITTKSTAFCSIAQRKYLELRL